MLYLIPLIIFAAAQECPYCRWNACSLTIGNLANCSDCYLGALVNYELNQDNLTRPMTIGVCVLCPKHCLSCEYAVMNASNQTSVPAVNCTNCNGDFVNNPEDGSCIKQKGRKLMEVDNLQLQTDQKDAAWSMTAWSSILAASGVLLAIFLGMKIQKKNIGHPVQSSIVLPPSEERVAS